ncbi:MAG TPA: GAF domain-containing sensor histidine kinase [Pseudonocardia sp.]|uniref:GAF domain-containing sensor histidine kinase n=1 Tax=Pseudonocardia sp. TaxID=60912 RepID=UPI002B836978|nr:GAF domain-containing sensor histidine kinase [Pseudonocardia sp.]HTF53738.1 GAF domain-containing sensor histidine kinase [Pseudonocardia sp.]
MPTVPRLPGATRLRPHARRAGLSWRRRLVGALTGLVVLPPLTLGLARLSDLLDLPSQMLFYLLAVVVVALVGGLVPALAAAVAAAGLLAYYFIPPDNFAVADLNDVVALVAFVLVAGAVSSVVGLAARRAREAENLATANAESREELRVLADEQAALRRVATLVARGVPAAEVFAAVAREAGSVLGADTMTILRLEPDGATTVLTRVGDYPPDEFPVGSRWRLEPPLPAAVTLRTGQPARNDDFSQASGGWGEHLRRVGIQSGVAAPIVVEGRLWGAIAVGTRRGHFPPGAEQRMAGFTELIGTAIANADSRAQLTASRARIVSAADATRRRIERDLHDGTQQRLVALGFELRLAQATVPGELPELQTQIGQVAHELDGVVEELREISRGIHPGILSEGGLGPALRTLARRAAIPVKLDIRTETRLADPIEVAAYYLVSEALTNTTKHARASESHVTAELRDAVLHLSILDDGIGGADPAGGSGLIGLRDRVQALGGTIDVSSAPGEGTAIVVELPLQPH